jgi:hypothetical protein
MIFSPNRIPLLSETRAKQFERVLYYRSQNGTSVTNLLEKRLEFVGSFP